MRLIPRRRHTVLVFAAAMALAVSGASAQQGGGGQGGPGGGPGGAGGVGGPDLGDGGADNGVPFAPGLALPAPETPAAIDPTISLPGQNYAPSAPPAQLASPTEGRVTLAAQLTEDSPEIGRGLVWRVFKPEPGADGKLPLVASAQGGTSAFTLEQGSYLVHASFGRAGATKRITVGREGRRESLVLDAGGLKLDAMLSGGVRIPPANLKFSIYEETEDATGERALIIPDVKPNTIVRLNAGTYHVVSKYGSDNAVIRADIRVEAGKVTEAMVEHKAAQLTMKLVREAGGEAIADTSWSIINEQGDTIRTDVGAFASMVLAEGSYTILAKNRERTFSRDFTVVPGRNQDVEVLANLDAPIQAPAD